jgi:hypothetical protein
MPSKLPAAGDFNATSRGYPDVAALGHNYVIWASGAPTLVDGTSCSAPVWGGVIGLANAARLAAGKKVLGYLNPAIYQIATATQVVTSDPGKSRAAIQRQIKQKEAAIEYLARRYRSAALWITRPPTNDEPTLGGLHAIEHLLAAALRQDNAGMAMHLGGTLNAWRGDLVARWDRLEALCPAE